MYWPSEHFKSITGPVHKLSSVFSVSQITENIMFYIRIDVFQHRLAEHIQVARLHCVVGYIKNEEVNSRLWWPQLGLNKGGEKSVNFNKNTPLHSDTQLLKPTMYSEGAMNSMVAFWTSGLLCGSPYDLLTGLYINSSGTTHRKT